jgi:3-methyladenine DNA glycosylase AlkD
MNHLDEKFNQVRKFCETRANPAIVQKYSRYFTEGYDAYGLDQVIYEHQRDYWLKAWKNEMSLEDYLGLGDKLIATGKYEEASFAIGFVASRKEEYKTEHFERIGQWLDNAIVNWAHTDNLCGRVLSVFFVKHLVELDIFRNWTKSDSKWKRRAVPVTMIDILNKECPLDQMFSVIDPIMEDDEKFVQKGLGWFLREAWKKYPEPVEAFMLKWKDTCGRTIIQYATEKMGKEYRLKFRKSKIR